MNYQTIVEDLRRKANTYTGLKGEKWPGHDGPACSRYPNIAAEIVGQSDLFYHVPPAMGVSGEVLAGVIEDGDELDLSEIMRLVRWYGCRTGYLMSPVLSLVDPATNKGKYRMRRLEKALRKVDELHTEYWWSVHITNGWKLLKELKRGHSVTWAAYSRSLRDAEEQIANHVPRPVVRTKRKATA